MRNIVVISAMVTALGIVAIVTKAQSKAEVPVGSLHPFGPAAGSTVTISLVKEARVTMTHRGLAGGTNVSGELAEVTGSLVYFGDDWISIQAPESGTRMWIPTRHAALVTQEAGARPRKQPGE